MLGRLRTSGRATLLGAKYYTDFAAVRQHSFGDGSYFAFKQLPAIEYSYGFEGPKGHTLNYSPLVFGYVDEVLTLGSFTYIRLKCPPKPTCAVAEMYEKQLASLENILQQDAADLGGIVDHSWFDCSQFDDSLHAVPGCFYVVGTLTSNIENRLRNRKAVMMKVSPVKVEDDGPTRLNPLTRSYWLDLAIFDEHDDEYFPRMRADVAYVCDVNGHRGCRLCESKHNIVI